MSVTLNLNADVERNLTVRAHELGVTLDEYLQQIVAREAGVGRETDTEPRPAKDLVELFAPLRGLGLDFSRKLSLSA